MHWTYERYKNDDDLRQGDILGPSDELKTLFGDVHPHFTDEKYRGFLVLSHTCDLVRREQSGGTCAATHISLSVIRSLRDIISDSLKDRFGFIAPGIYISGMKKAIESLSERLVNQNEEKLGLFYLHPDGRAGITVHSVAVLRVSISVRAKVHYPKLLKARMGRLSREFQPKLGWMVGNLYSRVGVTDWKEKASGQDFNEEQLISNILSFDRDKPLWLDTKIYRKLQKADPNFMNLSEPEQNKLIEEHMPPPPEDRVFEIIAKTIKNNSKLKDDQIEIINTRLRGDDHFLSQMKKFGGS